MEANIALCDLCHWDRLKAEDSPDAPAQAPRRNNLGAECRSGPPMQTRGLAPYGWRALAAGKSRRSSGRLPPARSFLACGGWACGEGPEAEVSLAASGLE